MRASLACAIAFAALACADNRNKTTAGSAGTQTSDAIVAEMYSEPPEAEVLDSQNDRIVVRAFPRYAMIENQATVVDPDGYSGPGPAHRYLVLKVRGTTCSEYWESGDTFTYPDLWFKTEYTFVLDEDSRHGCNVLEVRDDKEVLYSGR